MTHLVYLIVCYGIAAILLGASLISAILEWRKTRQALIIRLKNQ
jgi:hypothetical protein